MKPNDIIYIDDANIVCLVTECQKGGVNVEIKGSGKLKSHRSIKVTGGKHEVMPTLAPQDTNDILSFCVKSSIFYQLIFFIDCDIICVPYSVRRKDI